MGSSLTPSRPPSKGAQAVHTDNPLQLLCISPDHGRTQDGARRVGRVQHGPGGLMGIMDRSANSLGHVGGHAEQVYLVAEGAPSPPEIEEVSSSWQRSATKHGVDPVDNKAPRILTSGELKHSREPLDRLIFSAQEDVDQLYKLVREAGYVVLFCDSSGVAIEHRGEDSQARSFEYWGTWLGGVWSEEVEGTNGIGTCIVEERPITIHKSQHFRSRQINLSCSGAPVFGVDGRLLAVLDESAVENSFSARSIGSWADWPCSVALSPAGGRPGWRQDFSSEALTSTARSAIFGHRGGAIPDGFSTPSRSFSLPIASAWLAAEVDMIRMGET